VDGGLGRGGGPITKYTVTANPDGKIATTTSAVLTAIVAGLTNGTSYTFTVTATNAVGTSSSSTASNSILPVNGSPTVTASSTAFVERGRRGFISSPRLPMSRSTRPTPRP